ncbi:type II toxin-antitoxin system RelE/ParE family toxin [Maridesulfovibrio sp.]|uniref:type II toxin-antitoxin system RelE/ParE family toxin n=1 Tax=Maridesulfovibrio sp. TaxID=2795000 RepID=UPI002AA6E1DB|nr:type II toxin-antitoxin system RelE/ParE family toxin [Maridesulfovibrio sp.]
MYPNEYILNMNQFDSTDVFDKWLYKLKDHVGKARILSRIDQAKFGLFGDCKSVGNNVSEMRISVGPGYRVYFTKVRDRYYFLLAGGDKSSQKKDISKAHVLADEIRSEV